MGSVHSRDLQAKFKDIHCGGRCKADSLPLRDVWAGRRKRSQWLPCSSYFYSYTPPRKHPQCLWIDGWDQDAHHLELTDTKYRLEWDVLTHADNILKHLNIYWQIVPFKLLRSCSWAQLEKKKKSICLWELSSSPLSSAYPGPTQAELSGTLCLHAVWVHLRSVAQSLWNGLRLLRELEMNIA